MIDPRTFPAIQAAVKTWVQSMSSTVASVNALFDDAVLLVMPRDGDLLVTFPNDRNDRPQQPPYIIAELKGFVWDSQTKAVVSITKGTCHGCLDLVDDASSGDEARTKLARWIDVVMRHVREPTSIMGSFVRIVPRNLTWQLSDSRKVGQVNRLSITLEFDLPISF